MSRKINIQQLPKVPEFLECFESEPGTTLVYTDVSSLEPHVLTYYSRDPRMMSLYGPDAPEHQDIYLYFGAHVPIFADEIRKWYDPENPTKESIALAKKHCGETRDTLKTIVLGKSYGMGAKLAVSKLQAKGIDITLDEAKKITRLYDNFFGGVKKFGTVLLAQWEEQGFIMNGSNRPLAVDRDKSKDLTSRFIQSTGHDFFQHIIAYIEKERWVRSLDMRPYLVDEHDATVWQAADCDVPYAVKLFGDAYEALNEELGWDVKFKGSIKVGKSLSEVKLGT